MCLYVGNKTALVAKKDITVYKSLIHDGFRWRTPYQSKPVKLNSTITPYEYVVDYQEKYNKFAINGGVIHAYLETTEHCYCFKAIIKAGTTYYVQDDFTEIAAKELYITDKQVSGNVMSPDMTDIYRDYIDAVLNNPEYAGNNGISVGYYRLSDGTYANPLFDFDKTKAIGIVAFLGKKGNPVTMALESKRLPWLTDLEMRNKVYSDILSESVTEDMDGYKHTYDIRNGEDYDPGKFKAVEYCYKYKTEGTEEGEWYLGAIGEVIKIAQNMGILNAVMGCTGVGDMLEFYWCWSSSEKTRNGNSYALGCRLSSGNWEYCNSLRNSIDEVRPLSASINK